MLIKQNNCIKIKCTKAKHSINEDSLMCPMRMPIVQVYNEIPNNINEDSLMLL